jgi:hypothetical protein
MVRLLAIVFPLKRRLKMMSIPSIIEKEIIISWATARKQEMHSFFWIFNNIKNILEV